MPIAGTRDCVFVSGSSANVGLYIPGMSLMLDQGLMGGWTIRQLAFTPAKQLFCIGTLNNMGVWTSPGVWADPGRQYNAWQMHSIAFDWTDRHFCVGTAGNIGLYTTDVGWIPSPSYADATLMVMLAFDPDGSTVWGVSAANQLVQWTGSNW